MYTYKQQVFADFLDRKLKIRSSWESHLRSTGCTCNLSCGIAQCYLLPHASEHTPP